MKWQDISVDIKTLSPEGCRSVPWELSVPAPVLYTWIKSWKCIKLDFKDFFFFFFFFLNLKQMTVVTRCSCWHQNFVPMGLSAPAPGLYTCIKSWEKLYKIRLQRDFFETYIKWPSDKGFLLTSKLCSLGLSAPDLRLYTFIKSWKAVYKVRGWRDSF